MEVVKQNKMATDSLKTLFWKMGLPMISMILQALYNVVDSILVTNMPGTGDIANEALTYAFPIQILIIAIGILQALGFALKPLFTALCRLVIFVFPIAYLFTLSNGVIDTVWWTFPIAESLTAILSFFILKKVVKTKIDSLAEDFTEKKSADTFCDA